MSGVKNQICAVEIDIWARFMSYVEIFRPQGINKTQLMKEALLDLLEKRRPEVEVLLAKKRS